MTSKKLLNTVERCVDENLEGLVAINPGLRILKDTRVVVRADIGEVKKQGKVTVLSGGGSGHEPGHAGYVGAGMLSAAVAGSVFTSPPPEDILTGLRTIAKDNPGKGTTHNTNGIIIQRDTGQQLEPFTSMCRDRKHTIEAPAEPAMHYQGQKRRGPIQFQAGALVIVKNYTGDRINFGLSMERAKSEGITCEMVIAGEDCALASHDKTAGRRGLCGVLFLHKIAGALSEEGKTLDEITKQAQLVADNMGTIGLALGACSTPGSTCPLFHLEADQMELGLGLHGEAGVKRVKLLTAKETVKLMIDHMTNPENSTHLAVKKGDKVACMINNLGAMTVLEMNIIARETMKYLEEDLGLSVERVYCGAFVTSLEMSGVSITLLKLNDTFKRCLDAPTSAPAWPRPLLGPGQTDRVTPEKMEPVQGSSLHSSAAQSVNVSKEEGALIHKILTTVCDRLSSSEELLIDLDSEKEGALIHKILTTVCDRLASSEELLNNLDSESGDGDCGSTMARGAHAIKDKLGSLPVTNPSKLSLELAHIVETVMGGSSGGLYSLFFTSAALALQKDISGKSWLQALTNGIAAIQKYGKAEPGDRTMLDALWAAKETFGAKLSSMSTKDAFSEAVKASEAAAEGTKSMKAKAGRASYVSANLLTKPDPGATAVAIWLRATLDSLN